MFLGIDLGTASVKALLLGLEGEVIAEASCPYPVLSPQPGWAETPTDLWWQATVGAVRAATQGHQTELRAIGFSGQAHGLVALGADGTVLRPAILWPDRRAERELADLLALPEQDRLPLANPLALGMFGLTALWLSRNEPELFAKLDLALSPKDWLRFKLCGQAATEPTDASMTLLWDMATDSWSQPLLAASGLRPDQLAPVIGSSEIAGYLSAEAAAELGLPAGIPLAAGMSDCAACLLGMGLTKVGATVLQIGSGIQIMSIAPALPPRLQPFFNTFRAHGDQRYLMAAMLNGGTAFEWARGVLNASWDEMYDAAFAPGATSGGVLFLPYVAGERAPLLDPEASASWTGLRLGTSRAHMIRAVFEGVAFAIADSLAALKAEGALPEKLLLAGGGARDPRWRQLLADVTGMSLSPTGDHGHAALGAAFGAGLAVGHWRKADELPVPAGESVLIRPSASADSEGVTRLRKTYSALKLL